MSRREVASVDLLVETLRLRSDVNSDDLAKAWSRADPAGLYSLADYERAAMWILRRLGETEAEAAAPPALVGPLRRHVSGASARNMLVDAEGAAVVRLLDGEGIPTILLKGLARRAAGPLLPCGDARSTVDVDVLLAPADVDRAWTLLLGRGYSQVKKTGPAHHAPILLGPGGVGVELHRAMGSHLTPEESWRRANDDVRTVSWNGIKVLIPAPTELLWHGLTHALHHDLRAWRLRFFLDAASVLAGEEPVAWDIIGARLDAGEVDEALSPRQWLGAAAQLAGTPLPPGILRDAPNYDLTRVMRWRLGVLLGWRERGFGARLLDEGLRAELGLRPTGGIPGTGPYKRVRRRLGGLAARGVYRVWRSAGERQMRI